MERQQISKTLLAFAIGILFAGPGAANAANLGFIDFVPAAGRKDMAYDQLRDILYITDSSGDLLRYSVSTGSFLAPIHLGGSPTGVDISPDYGTLAVTNGAFTGTSSTAGTNHIDLVDLNTNSVSQMTFTRQGRETGTYSVAFTSPTELLLTSNFGGSGWVPMREVDIMGGSSQIISSVRQSTMLTPSADHGSVAYAEANISSGEFGIYETAGGTSAESGTGWFAFEIGISRDGGQVAVPSYGGTHVYDADFNLLDIIGTYADESPIGVVYSPIYDLVYFAWYDWGNQHHSIDAYRTDTLTEFDVVDAQPRFGWNGNGALHEGRLEISGDGSLLFATVDGGVNIYGVPEPSRVSLLMLSVVAALLCRRR